MACFIVPAAEAAVSTIITKALETKEGKQALPDGQQSISAKIKTPFSHKLKWLNTMLWGGSALLMFEHIWHGEVVPWFPFLTALDNPGDTAVMLREMSTAGVGMAACVTAVWAVMAALSSRREKRPQKSAPSNGEALP